MDLLIAGAAAPVAKWQARSWSRGVERGPRRGDRRDDFSRVVARESPGAPLADGPFVRVARAIFRFQIFPARLVRPVLTAETVEPGGLVGLRYRVMPGVELFFASRARERFEGRSEGLWRAGFTYWTLAGHPECGQETFSVEKHPQTGEVVAALRSWSRPGIWLTRLGAPITRLVQVHANRAALRQLAAVAAGVGRGRG